MKLGVIATGYAVFVLASIAPYLLARTSIVTFLDSHPSSRHFIVKTILLVFAATAMTLSRRSFKLFGFKRPVGVRWNKVVGIGALLGGLATTLILVTPATGMPNLQRFGLVGLIASIWFYSSVTEEVFVRGWLQTSLPASPQHSPVLVSGLFFGSMHLSLIAAGADLLTVAIIVLMTTCLGLQAASLRKRHASLSPPIVAHISFNVGGLATGILVNMASIALSGATLQP